MHPDADAETRILKVYCHDDVDPKDPRMVALFAGLLRRGWRLAYYRPEATKPFCLARGEPHAIRFMYYM